MGSSRSAERTETDRNASLANGYRALPSVDAVVGNPQLEEAILRYSRSAVTEAIRVQLQRARDRISVGGTLLSENDIISAAQAGLSHDLDPSLLPIINATGVVLHTNLGRAPLSQEAIDAVQRVAQGYSNLELDLDLGERGSRHDHIDGILQRITGAEAGFAVNNNAGAIMLALRAIAHGKKVITSRGEAVEIGGGFRIPDVVAGSDATLVEVGTTNRTYVEDYEKAVDEETAAFLKVHRSNFKITGFTHEPEIPELAEAASRHGIPLLYDLGSGCLLESSAYGLAHEPTPAEAIHKGADVVMFSGDKLLGGPQAGIVVGKKCYIDILREHPLIRAMRIDKLSLTALQVTLLHYLHDEAKTKIPVWRMISASTATLNRRARQVAKAIGPPATVTNGKSTIGGGTLPDEELPTRVVSIPERGDGLEAMAAALRSNSPPIVTRIEHDALIIDLRTVLPEQDQSVGCATRRILS